MYFRGSACLTRPGGGRRVLRRGLAGERPGRRDGMRAAGIVRYYRMHTTFMYVSSYVIVGDSKYGKRL